MRKLNSQQKKYLTDLYNETEVSSVGQLTIDNYENLVEMNDFETIYQETDRFLSDLLWNDVKMEQKSTKSNEK